MTDERWDAAITHAREHREMYLEVPNGMFGAILIQADIYRYERGERTIELLEKLEGIK